MIQPAAHAQGWQRLATTSPSMTSTPYRRPAGIVPSHTTLFVHAPLWATEHGQEQSVGRLETATS